METSPLLRSLVLSLTLLTSVPSFAAVEKEFNVYWTIYVGWMPWETISNRKVIDKWANKYGTKISIVQLNDYIEPTNQYAAGQFNDCMMTNMDALAVPVAGGVGSITLITGSYSDGNDGVVLKGADKKLNDLKGMSVYLLELSVSHYLLARGPEKAELREEDTKVVNTSDADIVSAFDTSGMRMAVAWSPQLSVIRKTPQTSEVFSFSQVPGELINVMIVNTQTLKNNPMLGKALTGTWSEMVTKMKAGDSQVLSAMAADSNTDLADYQAQLKTTRLFQTPADILAFIPSPDLAKTMQRVAQFSFDKGLLGEGAQSTDFVGVTFPGSVTFGNTVSRELRFDGSYLKLTAVDQL